MLKKYILLLILIPFLAIPTLSVLSVAAFNDVNTNSRYYNHIKYLQDKNIVKGFSDGTFRPDRKITRAELIKIIISSKYKKSEYNLCLERYLGDSDESNLFTDFPIYSNSGRNDLFAPYVCMAKYYNIISGYSDGSLRSDRNITVKEASKILANTFDITNPNSNTSNDKFYIFTQAIAERGGFSDEISSYDNEITRGQFAFMLYMIHTDVNIPTLTPTNTPTIVPTISITPPPVNESVNVHGIGLPWQFFKLGNTNHKNAKNLFTSTKLLDYTAGKKIPVINWMKGQYGECLNNDVYYIPVIWKPTTSVTFPPDECKGRPLMLGNECEQSDQCNTSADKVADMWNDYRNWDGGTALCGALIQQGYTHCLNTFKSYKDKYGKDKPDNAKWLHLHAYWFAYPFDSQQQQDMRENLRIWRNLAETKGLKIVVTEWGVPFGGTDIANGAMQKAENIIYEELDPEFMLYFAFYYDASWPGIYTHDLNGNILPAGIAWKKDIMNKR